MKHLLLILFVAISVTAFGQGHRELSIDFNYLFTGNVGVTLGATNHHHTDGAELQFDMATFYVSNIRVVPVTGSEVVFDTVLLISGNNIGQPFVLGQLPEGTYNTIKFDLGLDSTRNHSDPTTYAASHPLALQFPSMHWSWASGYIFTKIEGLVDTTAAQTGGPTVPFEYHIGSDGMKRQVSVPIADVVVDSNTHEISASLDLMLGTVIGGLDLINGNDLATHTMDNMPLANNVANNMQSAFVGEVSRVQLPTSVTDVVADAGINIYPNPLQSHSTIEIKAADANATLEVVDVTGKTIFAQPISGTSTQLHRGQFPAAGIYMVKVSGRENVVRKLVVY